MNNLQKCQLTGDHDLICGAICLQFDELDEDIWTAFEHNVLLPVRETVTVATQATWVLEPN